MNDERATIVHRVRALLDVGTDDVDLDDLRPSEGVRPLPPVDALPPVPLAQVLAIRRSRYRFADLPPDAIQIAQLLRWSAGSQRTVRLPDGQPRTLSVAPSAGGLPSIRITLAVPPGSDLPAGLYRLGRAKHEVEILRTGDPRPAMRSVLVQPEFVRTGAVVLLLTAHLDPEVRTYPARHYRTLHVDAGIVLQNLYLVSTALGLAGCAVTGFNDGAVVRLLELSDSEFPVAAFVAGRPPA